MNQNSECVGGPAGHQGMSASSRPVGPTLRNAWGDRPAIKEYPASSRPAGPTLRP